MAHEYYNFNQSSVNDKIMMNVNVFDEITKKTVNEMKNVSLDTSKGFSIPGTKAVVSCSIKDNEVYICIHVRIKYGVKISTVTNEIQKRIATAIKQMTDVDVKKIDIEVDNIEFD
ncbi:MAG: Asp23/Gls24 family envelope stress response protein [Erysipelotrichaceae bacterium]|nr:Asp23/Gls24 family envelope stress response protein [Erysipelotrichaceae bacterium]